MGFDDQGLRVVLSIGIVGSIISYPSSYHFFGGSIVGMPATILQSLEPKVSRNLLLPAREAEQRRMHADALFHIWCRFSADSQRLEPHLTGPKAVT